MPVSLDDRALACAGGHHYPVVQGIPVMLVDGVPQTHRAAEVSLSITGAEASAPPADVLEPAALLETVGRALGGTCGNLYRRRRLQRFPIPDLPLSRPGGTTFLDIGCNWGRWVISAARKGYQAVGIDPSLPAIQTARQVARHLGCEPHLVVADGRYLPFRDHSFDVVFSYSVLQHFAEEDVRVCLARVRRVLTSDGLSCVQMPTRFGALNLFQQMRRGFRTPRDFEVRYWSRRSLVVTFEREIGPSRLTIDGYFTLNPRLSDLDVLSPVGRAIVRASERLRALSHQVPALAMVADSLFVESIKADAGLPSHQCRT